MLINGDIKYWHCFCLLLHAFTKTGESQRLHCDKHIRSNVMKSFRKFLTSGLLAAGMTIAGSANAAFVSFFFNPAGTGAATGVSVSEFLDFTGAVYAENTYTGATSFEFDQYGYAQITGRDSGSVQMSFILNEIYASFSGSGTGDLATGATSFLDGTLNLYKGGLDGNVNTLIASFAIVGGGSQITSTTGAPNGASTLIAQATSFAEGYFFTAQNGTDFSTLNFVNAPLFGFATSNLSLTTATVAQAEQRGFLEQAFPTDTFTTGNTTVGNGDTRLVTLYSGGNGQFRLTETSVPAPGVLALMGLGLLGLGAARRRRAV
jgi:hypothetical protein